MRYVQRFIVTIAMTIGCSVTGAFAQSDSIFTFQGELTDSGVLANGTFNMDFSLWDAATSGNLVGSILMIDNVPVSDGRFTVELDFGVAAFDNSDRFLEIEVQGDTLSPRQPITRVPYAMQTRGMFVDSSDNVGIGTTAPKAPLHVAGDYYGSGHLFLHAQEGDGASGTAYVQARDDSGSSSINLRLRTQLNGQIVNTMTLSSIGRVGIGTTTPQAALHVANPIPLLYLQDQDSTGSAQSGYVSLRDSSGTERGWFGYGSQVNSDLTVANDIGDVVLDSTDDVVLRTDDGRLVVHESGGVGIGLNPGEFVFNALQVRGNKTGPSASQHLVHFDNTSNSTPAILALRASSLAQLDEDSHYITFFNSNDVQMGAITGLSQFGVPLIGVRYTSGGGDFAEYIRLLDAQEPIGPGDVVAVRSGTITRDTDGTRRVMVVSTAPAFVGNDRRRTSGDDHRLVALTGQVPVKVRGPVDAGDYLVASGLNDGTAIAVPPRCLHIEQLPLVVGTAWETSHAEGIKTVNSAVGVDQAAAAHEIVMRLEERLSVSETRLAIQQGMVDELSMRLTAMERQIADAGDREAVR